MKKTVFINNEFLSSDIKSEVIDPFTGEVIEEISLATKEQAEKALFHAQRAFLISKREPSYIRKKRLLKLALEIAKNKDDFAKLIAIEAAKPLRLARGEVERALITLREAAEEATRIEGEYLDLEIDKNLVNTKSIVKYEPAGIVYSISPFNFPLNLMMHKVAPAIAIGAPVIIKPPKQTPLTAIKFANMVLDADLPAGLVQVLPSDNDVAEMIIKDDRVKIISFTGSDTVGDIISKMAYNKKVLLELGGIATMVVDKTADIERAGNRAVVGAFAYSGQICISVQRILAHKDIFDKFKEKLIEETNKIKVGSPLDDDILVSSLIDENGVKKFNRLYHDAVVKKASILVEPKIKGNLISPTIVESDNDNLLLNKEEAFSPIVLLRKYETFEEAVGIVNSNRYGLQTALFSDSYKLILRAMDEFESGGVIINDYPTFRVDKQPYGGIKSSGKGREGLRYAIREFAEIKTVIFR